MGTKRTKQQDFQTTWTKLGLVLNPGHGIKKSKVKTQCVHDMNAKRFYYKNMTRIEQNHDKNTYPKLVLNKPKIMCDFTSTYTNWAPSSRKLFKKKFNLYVAHVHLCSSMCDPCLSMWKLIMNYKLIKNELKINLKWTKI